MGAGTEQARHRLVREIEKAGAEAQASFLLKQSAAELDVNLVNAMGAIAVLETISERQRIRKPVDFPESLSLKNDTSSMSNKAL